MKIKVSIIIVNYNTFDLTKKCIDSIYRYETKLNFEVILVDNASSDGSVAKFEKIIKNYKNFYFIKSHKNLGFAKGNNLGIKKAKGEYIFLLNSDAQLIKKDSIFQMIEFVENNNFDSEIGAIVPQLLNFDKSIQGSVLYLPTISRAISEFILKRKKFFGLYSPRVNNPTKVEAAVMAAFLITPKAFQKIKKLDSRYFMYFEDLQYCKDLKNNNLDIYFLPEVKILHYHGASGKNIVKNKDQWKRQIPSSKIYHGVIRHYIIFLIMYLSQKFNKNEVK